MFERNPPAKRSQCLDGLTLLLNIVNVQMPQPPAKRSQCLNALTSLPKINTLI